MVGRRRFLLLGIGGSAAALVGGGSLNAAAAAPTMVPVWRLSANWGYPVPPKHATRCRCTACRTHAANKVFASKAIATAHRIHPCCVCQPYSIDLLASDAAALFATSPSGTIDLRNSGTRGAFEAAVVRSVAPEPEPEMQSPPVPAVHPTPNVPPPAAASRLMADPPAPASASAESVSKTRSLPVTGGDHETLLATAGVLVVAGVAAAVAAGSSST